MRTVCVDQSGFRSKELARLISQTDDRFVVADAALMEMCKSTAHWERTLRRSLELLSTVPDRVWFVLGNGECMTAELSTQQPITLDAIVSDEITEWLRSLLVEVANTDSGPAFQLMAANIEEANRDAQRQHLNNAENRARLVGLVDTLRHAYSSSFQQRLRAGGVSEEEYVQVVSHATTLVVDDESMSWPEGATKALFDARSYTARWLWLRVETVTSWLAKGGIESARPDRLTNSEVDNYYLAVGSYCDQFVSDDRRALEKDRRLRAALAIDVPWRMDISEST